MPYFFNPKGCRLRWRWITCRSIIVEEDEMDVAVMMIWAVSCCSINSALLPVLEM